MFRWHIAYHIHEARAIPCLSHELKLYIYHYICCHITSNDTCIILIRDFSKEQHELPEDDKQCAIETCRSLLGVLVFQCKKEFLD
jgi:hypothetical protein